jgi:hypothetical protein
MAYRKPFTPLQRREAVRAYKSYRKHRSQLRRRYPPTTEAHRNALNAYGDAIDEMKAELEKRDHQVDVDALNRADASARWFATDYWRLHYPR